MSEWSFLPIKSPQWVTINAAERTMGTKFVGALPIAESRLITKLLVAKPYVDCAIFFHLSRKHGLETLRGPNIRYTRELPGIALVNISKR